jgi:RNA polymerase sigma factor (sigma-70 family)
MMSTQRQPGTGMKLTAEQQAEIEKLVPLARRIIRDLHKSNGLVDGIRLTWEEAMAEAHWVLCNRISDFDPQKGNTYAFFRMCIKSALLRQRNRNASLYIPYSTRWKHRGREWPHAISMDAETGGCEALTLHGVIGGADRFEDTLDIKDALLSLNEDLRETLTLRMEGLSYDKIAKALSISRSAAGIRLTKARRQILRYLADA